MGGSRCLLYTSGFKMGGKAPYGFHTEPIKMDGINTKKLVVNSDEAANIRLMFEMYAQPTTSYGDTSRSACT